MTALRFSALACIAATTLTAQTAQVPAYQWSTLAGRATIGREDGRHELARFHRPHGLAHHPAQWILYVADSGNHTIRRANGDSFTTVAGSPGKPGSADGNGAAARFNTPKGIAVDAAGNVYVADSGNFTIRKLSITGDVTTLAGQTGQRGTGNGPAGAALFDELDQIGCDHNGAVYVADHGIRKIANGVVSTLFDTATIQHANGTALTVSAGRHLSVDPSGIVYCEAYASPWDGPGLCIVKIAVDGTLSFDVPPEVFAPYPYNFRDKLGAMSPAGANGYYFAARDRPYYGMEWPVFHRTPDGVTSVATTNDSSGWPAEPLALASGPLTGLICTRAADSAITGIMPPRATYAGTPLSPALLDGLGDGTRFTHAVALAVDSGGTAWVADGLTRRFVENEIAGGAALRRIAPDGTVTTPRYIQPTVSPATHPSSLAVDGTGNVFFGIHDYYKRIERRTPGGTVTPLPDLPDASRYYATDTAANTDGVLAQLEYQGAVRKWDPVTNQWSLLAGLPGNTDPTNEPKDGTGAEARFAELRGITADRNGDFLVLDSTLAMEGAATPGCWVRRITPQGVVTTLSRNLVVKSTREPAGIAPFGIAVDNRRRWFLLYPDETIRLLTSEGDPVIVGGVPWEEGSVDGRGAAALFWDANALAIDATDNLYVADARGQTIRKGTYLGAAPVITGQPAGAAAPAGSTITLTVTASGEPAPTYQWFRDNVAVSGATSSTLTLGNLSATNAGSYTVAVSTPVGSVTSNTAVVSITQPPPSNGGGSSGGGGAPSAWFLGVLATLALLRHRISRAA